MASLMLLPHRHTRSREDATWCSNREKPPHVAFLPFATNGIAKIPLDAAKGKTNRPTTRAFSLSPHTIPHGSYGV